jgi:predicted hotdog family 3-hydroxylacyl-ACP dehydratase
MKPAYSTVLLIFKLSFSYPRPSSPGVPEANWTHAAADMLLLRRVKSVNNDDQITLSVQVRCTNPFGALAQLSLPLCYCI